MHRQALPSKPLHQTRDRRSPCLATEAVPGVTRVNRSWQCLSSFEVPQRIPERLV